MFRDILTEPQQTVLELLSRIVEIRTPQDLFASLRAGGDLHVLQETAGTVTVVWHGVPTSFFHYDYPTLRPFRSSPWRLHIADPEDIAAMKLSALAGRGSRKDFVDLYVYAQEIAPLERVFDQFRAKYRGSGVSRFSTTPVERRCRKCSGPSAGTRSNRSSGPKRCDSSRRSTSLISERPDGHRG